MEDEGWRMEDDGGWRMEDIGWRMEDRRGGGTGGGTRANMLNQLLNLKSDLYSNPNCAMTKAPSPTPPYLHQTTLRPTSLVGLRASGATGLMMV